MFPRLARARSARALTCGWSLVAVGDAASGEVVRGQFDLDAIAREDPDVVHPHLPGDVGEDLVTVLELDAEHGVRQRLGHRPFQDDRVFFGLGQRTTPYNGTRWSRSGSRARERAGAPEAKDYSSGPTCAGQL